MEDLVFWSVLIVVTFGSAVFIVITRNYKWLLAPIAVLLASDKGVEFIYWWLTVPWEYDVLLILSITLGFYIYKKRKKMSMYFKKDTFDVKFFIDKKDINAAFIELKKYFQHLSLEKINVDAVMASINLEELLNACRWTPTFDNLGDIIDIAPIYDNVGNEEYLFEGIAEFVKEGSYVEYQREGNDANLKFRFEFNKEFTIKKWAECFDMNGNQYWEEISDY